MSPSRLAVLALVLLGLCGLAAPARAEWLRAETDHFVIYGDTSERAITNYARKLETFDALLRTYYPVQVDHEIPKLEIFMADGRRDMLRAAPGISASVGGFYSPNSSRIHAVADVSSPMSDDVIFHEYAHHFMFQMVSKVAYPAWFVEGFAEYYATVRIQPDRIQIGRFNPGRVNSLTLPSNSWPPMEDVLSWRVSPNGRFRGSDYYAISWALTHYLLSTPERTRQLGQYLSAVAGGRDPVEALNGTINRTPAQLQSDVRRYVSGPIEVLTPQIEMPNPSVEVTRLSREEADLIWVHLRLDRANPLQEEPELEKRQGETDEAFARRQAEAVAEFREDRAQLVADAAAAAARHPSSPIALLVKAKGERLARRPADAVETLRPIAGPESENALALRYYATALLDVLAAGGDGIDASRLRADARGALAQSLDLDPLDFQTYLALDRLRRGQAGYPTDNDISTLQVAMTLAPQSFDTRIRLAQALLAREDTASAMNVLYPVANSPHGGPTRSRARALMTQARQQAGLEAAQDEPAPEDETAPEDAPAAEGADEA
jgi:hypothetical protein